MSLSRDLGEMIMDFSAGWRRHAGGTWSLPVGGAVLDGRLPHPRAIAVLRYPYAVYRLAQMARRRSLLALAGPDIPWIAALAAFGLMTEWPASGSSGSSRRRVRRRHDRRIPFRGLLRAAPEWIEHGLDSQQILVVPQLTLLIVLVVFAFRSTANLPAEDRWLRWALVGATAIAASLSKTVWVGPAELRQIVVLSTIAWLVIISSKQPIPTSIVAATGSRVADDRRAAMTVV